MKHRKPCYTTPFYSMRTTGPLRPGADDYRKLPSGDGIGTTARVDLPYYTGTELLGIATMHKSNAVPITRSSDMAIAISKMRRS